MVRKETLNALLSDYQSELEVLEMELARAEKRIVEILEVHRERIRETRDLIAKTELEIARVAEIGRRPRLDDLIRQALSSSSQTSDDKELGVLLDTYSIDQATAKAVALSDRTDSEKARIIATYFVERAEQPLAHRNLMKLMINFLKDAGTAFQSGKPSDMATKAFRRHAIIKSEGVKGYWMNGRPVPRTPNKKDV